MKYRKKPVVIDAVQWTGDDSCLRGTIFEPHYQWGAIQRVDRGLLIKTHTEGSKLVSVRDWLIWTDGVGASVCKPDVFAANYEALEPESAE